MLRLRRMLPSLVTMLTLTFGLAALEVVRLGDWDLALRFILLAAIADGVDGKLARQMGATSRMGEQLDSLADIIAFGAAPAFLFATYYANAHGIIRFGVPLGFVLAGSYRLARFHAYPRPGAFCGLPITAAGAILAVIVAGPFALLAQEAVIVGIVLAGLMICCHPFPKFAQSRRWLLAALIAATIPVALWPKAESLAILAGLAFGAYVIWGVVGRLVGDHLPKGGLEEVSEVGKPVAEVSPDAR